MESNFAFFKLDTGFNQELENKVDAFMESILSYLIKEKV